MTRALAGLALLLSGTAATAATSSPTDFGVRSVGAPASAPAPAFEQPSSGPTWSPVAKPIDMRSISALGARWGTVTSTYRSPERNRRVGGARNSYHLRGRAIDIARRAGVSHSQIAAAYRSAGYRLVESLDEGDHSHFAFGTGAAPVRARPAVERTAEVTSWRIVTAPGAMR